MSTIFVVEDDLKIKEELVSYLHKYGYSCSFSDDFENIVSVVIESKPDLILLDVNLPYYDGYHVCREIRKTSNVPIIIVTSRDSELDELMSMNFGADDFITKPYNTQILLARISTVLRRTQNVEVSYVLIHKDVELDVSKSIVKYQNQIVELTKNESRILNILMKNKGCIVSRDDIMQELWQSEEFVDDNTLTVNINRLRKKLEDIGIIDFLITKRGQGYMV